MTVSRCAAALIVVATVVLVACTGAAGGTPIATSAVDLPRSYKFAPADITVTSGTTVTWTNSDNFTHNVQFTDEGLAGEPLTMQPGEIAQFTFAAPGTYEYLCSLHPQDMKGRVVVTE